ncbi:hypothetical protein B0E41_00775 [Hydrogenophaga sp. A37]|nr:hypothetical protein B0E41_00775 [Hydrogenophaga sp. A37]
MALQSTGVSVFQAETVSDLQSIALMGGAIRSEYGLVLFGWSSSGTVEVASLLEHFIGPQTPAVFMVGGVRRLAWVNLAAPSLEWNCGVSVNALNPKLCPAAPRLYLSSGPKIARWATLFEQSKYDVQWCGNRLGLQYGRILRDLGRGLLLISGGKTLQEDRLLRVRYARLLNEVHRLISSAGIKPCNLMGVPWVIAPTLLRLNNSIFTWLAARSFAGLADEADGTEMAAGRVADLVASTCDEVIRLAVGSASDVSATIDLREQLGELIEHGDRLGVQTTSHWG